MKTKDQLLAVSAVALLGAYSIYSSVRIRQLEGQLNRLQREQLARPVLAQVVYGYGDSFIKYFGQKGVAAVEQAIEIMRNPKVDRAPRNEEIDWDARREWHPEDRPSLDGK